MNIQISKAALTFSLLSCLAMATSGCLKPPHEPGSPDSAAVAGTPSTAAAPVCAVSRPTTPASGPVVSTVAGTSQGFVDGPGDAARFAGPYGVAADANGNLFVADLANNRIRKIDPCGNVITLAGNGTLGDTDGTGGPNGSAEFYFPSGVAVDAQDNVYVADLSNRIRKIDPQGNVTTLAGNGAFGHVDGTGGRNGSAEFLHPIGIVVDAQDNVYVADEGNNCIRKIDAQGNVSTLAGNGIEGSVDGTGGPDGTAELSRPTGLAMDAQGNLFASESGRVVKIDPQGNVTTYAAEIADAEALVVDAQGNVFTAEPNDHLIRKIDTQGNVTSFAGTGADGTVDGPYGSNGTATFSQPHGLAIDSQGNIFVADQGGERIRMISQ